MDYKIITTTEEFTKLKDDWQKIENQSPKITVFSTFNYCFNWWKIYQNINQVKLWIIVVIHNKKIVGIAPLIIETLKIRFSFKIDIVKFLAYGDYHDFLIDNKKGAKADNIYKVFFSVFEKFKNSWDKISLTHIAHNSLLTNFLLKSKFNKSFTPLIENPYVELSNYESFEVFLKSRVTSKINYYINRLQKKFNYSFENNKINIFDCAIIDNLEKIYVNKKGLAHRHSIFDDKLKSQFIKSLESEGNIEIYSLRDLDTNKIIIYNWGFIKDSVFYSVNTAFDPIFKNFRVGKVMYYEMINHAFKTKKFIRLDCGTGRYPWKFEWTNDFNLLYQLNIDKPRSKFLKKYYMLKKLLNR
tara:strand:- start:3342 stop:4409 length:1068 start_codon:yes stop_codon:yes gene_type:complete